MDSKHSQQLHQGIDTSALQNLEQHTTASITLSTSRAKPRCVSQSIVATARTSIAASIDIAPPEKPTDESVPEQKSQKPHVASTATVRMKLFLS